VQNNTTNENINFEPVDVARRTDRSRVIVNCVAGKLCTFFVSLKEEHGERVRTEILGARAGESGGELRGEGLRGWKTWTGLIWLRILRISGLL
jgi:hypothetical protein